MTTPRSIVLEAAHIDERAHACIQVFVDLWPSGGVHVAYRWRYSDTWSPPLDVVSDTPAEHLGSSEALAAIRQLMAAPVRGPATFDAIADILEAQQRYADQ